VNALRRNTTLLLVSNIGSAVFSFALSALIGRAFGDDGLGLYAVIAAWIYPISLVVEFGIGTLLTRDLAQRPAETHTLVYSAVASRLIFGAFAIVIIVIAAPLISDDPRIIAGIRISAPMVIILPLFSTFTAVLRARDHMLPIPFLNIGMIALQVVLTLIALVNDGGFIGVLLANVVSSAVQMIGAYAAYRLVMSPPTARVRLRPFQLARRAWHFALAALFAALQLRLSTILLETLTTTREVGLFFAATRFIEAARLFPNAYFGALYPALSTLTADRDALSRTFRRAFFVVGLFGIAAGIVLSVTAAPLIRLVFGDDFAAAAPAMIVLGWSLLGYMVRGALTLKLYALNRQPLVNLVNAAAILLQIALSLWLIPAYGASGAAFALVVIEFAAFAVLWLLQPRRWSRSLKLSPTAIDTAALASLFAFSLLVRLHYAQHFNGLYGQDAYAYYDFAARIAQSEPLAPFFWGLGYPLTLAGVFAVFGVNSAVAQAISLVMGAALAPVVVVIARRIGLSFAAALSAGVIIAVCGQAVQSSIVIMADIPALFFAACSLYVLTVYLQSKTVGWLFAAAVLLTVAIVTRWLYAALLPACFAYVLLTWRGVRWRASFQAALIAGLAALPQLAFGWIYPFPVLDHAWVQGWSWTHAAQRTFVNVDGQFAYSTINAQFYAAPIIDAYYLAPILIPCVLLGVVTLWRQRALWMLLCLWILVPYIFLIGIPYQNIRFPLILMPPIALFAAAGVETLFSRLPARLKLSAWVGIAVLIIVLCMRVFDPIVADFAAAQRRDQQTVTWAAAIIPDDALVYTMNLTLPLRGARTGEVRDLYYQTPAALAAARDRDPVYLLVNRWQIEHQWAGREPDIALRWLIRRRGLIRIGRHANYTLYQVRP
jgi:O-antigen/teichoic acid export membrane protein